MLTRLHILERESECCASRTVSPSRGKICFAGIRFFDDMWMFRRRTSITHNQLGSDGCDDFDSMQECCDDNSPDSVNNWGEYVKDGDIIWPGFRGSPDSKHMCASSRWKSKSPAASHSGDPHHSPSSSETLHSTPATLCTPLKGAVTPSELGLAIPATGYSPYRRTSANQHTLWATDDPLPLNNWNTHYSMDSPATIQLVDDPHHPCPPSETLYPTSATLCTPLKPAFTPVTTPVTRYSSYSRTSVTPLVADHSPLDDRFFASDTCHSPSDQPSPTFIETSGA